MLERLLDSVILIDHFNSVPQATEFLLALDPEKTAISVISYAEILTDWTMKGQGKRSNCLAALRCWRSMPPQPRRLLR
jgi:hypothetical protein